MYTYNNEKFIKFKSNIYAYKNVNNFFKLFLNKTCVIIVS